MKAKKVKVVYVLLCIGLIFSACEQRDKEKSTVIEQQEQQSPLRDEIIDNTEEVKLSENPLWGNEISESVWNLTEEEKKLSYEGFKEQRIEYNPGLTSLYVLNRCNWFSTGERIMADDPDDIRIPLEDHITNYAIRNEIFVGVTDDKEMALYEYNGTKHLLCYLDEKVTKILLMDECAFYQTETGKVYRIHFLSQTVDYVTDLQEKKLKNIYDTKSFLYQDGPYYADEGICYYDMEAGKQLPLPEDYERTFEDYLSNSELEMLFRQREEFKQTRKRYVASEGKGQVNGYAVDEEGNLKTWILTEGEETATIIDRNISGLFQWNEYVYFYDKDILSYRINGYPASAYILGREATAQPIEIIGNDEYILVYERFGISLEEKINLVLLYVPSLELSMGVNLEEGIHNIYPYDNMSFLYDDADGNTHYYDFELEKELPVPDDYLITK